MSKDDLETECMNELFGKLEDELPYVNHWRPVAIIDTDGEEIRKLTKEEQIAWIRQQRIIMDVR